MIRHLCAGLALTTLSATPVVAAPQPIARSAATVVANPAAALSLRQAVRAGSPTRKDGKLLAGGFLIAAIAVIAVIAGVVIVADSDDGPDSP